MIKRNRIMRITGELMNPNIRSDTRVYERHERLVYVKTASVYFMMKMFSWCVKDGLVNHILNQSSIIMNVWCYIRFILKFLSRVFEHVGSLYLISFCSRMCVENFKSNCP